MSHSPFLKQIADYYAHKGAENLSELCFVFPNKRSATFFRHYLRKAVTSGKPWIEPDFVDVSRFVARFTPHVEATRYESLFTLFNCYLEEIGKGSELSFDRFLFWGEMIINDFNDVDRYLVDASSLFTNLQRLKEIGSTYLTPEQIEIISRYWGLTEEEQRSDAERFWLHIQNPESKSATRFKRLWEVLGNLYKAYISSLEQRNLTTRGRLYRLAAERSRDIRSYCPEAGRFIFIGFNVLTTSELKIFRNLKTLGLADFFWDFNSPGLNAEMNKAGRFIRRNMEEFPSPADFYEEKVETFPAIEIVGVPSGIGQTKIAATTLNRWIDEKKISPSTPGIDTAVVLPDESLFIPMIHSMPSAVQEMNVTMGFPMRLSPISALIGNYRTLQKNARRDSEGNVIGYYYEDVRNMLSTPLVQSLDPEKAAEIIKAIKQRRLFTVSPLDITGISDKFKDIFAPIQLHASAADTVATLHNLIGCLGNAAKEASDSLTLMFLDSYSAAVNSLHLAMSAHKITMDSSTFLHLISRAVRGDTIRFSGEPLRGLQVMGMLETRSLDFKNLIVTSMNERVFPRKQYSRSFIPDVLRRAYGMATADFQESIFAYYFYRLISRADNVCLIYDSRSIGGVRSNERSRYLTQLLYLFPEAAARHIAARFKQGIFKLPATSIDKTPEVMEKLRLFATEGSGRTLSASAINTYINCPLLFYLQYVERYNPDQEITDYIDSSTYGSIVHQVMERLYSSQQKDGEPVVITGDFIRRVIKPECNILDTLIHEAVNNFFHHITDPERFKPLKGETAVLGKVIRYNVVQLLNREIDIAPFTFVAAEKRILSTMEINSDLKINIKQVIDRIDIINTDEGKLMRIVDYKTGSDEMSTPDIASLFDPELEKRPKAIMQILFYCYVYAASTGYAEAILPIIYKMRDLSGHDIVPLKIGPPQSKEPINDYREYLDDFLSGFKGVIEEIFDPEKPFAPSPDDSHCKFCNFKSLCTKNQ